MEKCDPEFGDFPMNFSYGLVVRRPGETNEELYERADEKMYADKWRAEAADSDHPRGDQ
jgi:PleD family two-component response regulator